MSQEKFSCPNCGLLYDFRPGWAGQKAKCKCCQKVFMVPDRPGVGKTPEVIQPATKPQPTAKVESAPEAKIVLGDKPVSAIPQARVVQNVEPAPFLEPIDEPGALPSPNTYEAVPSSTFGGKRSPTRRFTPSGNRLSKNLFVGYLASRPLVVVLILATLIYFAVQFFSGDTAGLSQGAYLFVLAVMTIPLLYSLFVIYLGLRADRGEAWNKLLIKVSLVFLSIFGLILVGFSFLPIMFCLSRRMAIGYLPYAITHFVGTVIIFAIVFGAYYILTRAFGFYRTNASFLILVYVLGVSARMAGFPSMNGDHPEIAQKNTADVVNPPNPTDNPFEDKHPTPTRDNPPNVTQFPPKDNNPFGTPSTENVKANPFGTTEETPSKDSDNPFETTETPSGNQKNPFQPTETPSKDPDNPFETTETPGGNQENPFQPTETPSKDPENSFETTETPSGNQDNPFQPTETPSGNQENPFETTETPSGNQENPFQPPSPGAGGMLGPTPSTAPPQEVEEKPMVSSIGAVELDEILKRLDHATTSNVKSLLKALLRYTPTDEQREIVCGKIVVLFGDERFSAFQTEIIESLAHWMTPKVSDDVIKVVNASARYQNLATLKALASIPDDKIAAMVVEYWAKKPLLLQEAIPPLGVRAEAPLWKVLDSPDDLLRANVCDIIAQQGTAQSIPKLEKLKTDKKRFVAQAAERAIKSLSK